MRILIVESDEEAGEALKASLASVLGDEIESMQTRRSLDDASATIWERPLDLVVLDLELGAEDGFGLLKGAPARAFQTIALSSRPELAQAAIEFGVADFVPKPFSAERIGEALGAAKARLAEDRSKLLSIPQRGSPTLVPLEEVCYFEASDKRSIACSRDGRQEICNKLLRELEPLLPRNYLRVHRSFILNTREVERVSARASGRYFAAMRNGEIVPVSRGAHRALQERIEECRL